jgi:hypothetical protein
MLIFGIRRKEININGLSGLRNKNAVIFLAVRNRIVKLILWSSLQSERQISNAKFPLTRKTKKKKKK